MIDKMYDLQGSCTTCNSCALRHTHDCHVEVIDNGRLAVCTSRQGLVPVFDLTHSDVIIKVNEGENNG